VTPPPTQPDPPESVSRLARDLTGDMRCLKCGYNLRGLSITQVCPECSLPVKATLLAVVDPLADELAPLRTPRFTGVGVVLWPLGAILACVVVWGFRLRELVPSVGVPLISRWWITLGLLGFALSAVGALSLVRPYPTSSRRSVARNALAVALYLPAAWCFWWIHARLDIRDPMPYASIDAGHEVRAVARLGVMFGAVGIIALLRPTARAMFSRSILVREGRVDRQQMVALIGAFLLSAAGDAVQIVGNSLTMVPSDLTRTVEVLLVALGSVLITLGLFGLLRDSVRVYPVICANPLGLADILGKRREPRP
jgi:hypothetical protein